MRELKFRVWDKHYKQYVKPYAICLDGRAIVITEPSNDLETLDSERVIIEQYTGVKDKNGKKVYIGDIVLVANHGMTPYVATECDCSFVFKNENLIDFVYMFKTMPQCYEIIGNIHETPELINSENESKECEE